jgi:hypothetical protein
MSKAKEAYYEHKKIADLNFEGHIDAIDDYVKELEKQNEEMKSFMLHLWVNYEMPYGTMDIKTKIKFKELMTKYSPKGK